MRKPVDQLSFSTDNVTGPLLGLGVAASVIGFVVFMLVVAPRFIAP